MSFFDRLAIMDFRLQKLEKLANRLLPPKSLNRFKATSIINVAKSRNIKMNIIPLFVFHEIDFPTNGVLSNRRKSSTTSTKKLKRRDFKPFV